MKLLEQWHGGRYSVILWQPSERKFEVTIYSNKDQHDHISEEFPGRNLAGKCFVKWINKARNLDKKK